jgi:hypothetical protein
VGTRCSPTITGNWGYLEQPWTATAGSFVYETPGEGHTLVAYESEEPMRCFFVVKGPLVWLDEDGNGNGSAGPDNIIRGFSPPARSARSCR